MVVFTCNNCGDSLQKPKVEKHYLTTCRGSTKSLTCVDCFKDFLNEDYSSHIKCVTEEERYAAKGSFPKGVVKKGELKQESWVETVKSVIQNTPNQKPGQKAIFSVLSNSTNVPRKKNKFINFLKSSLGRRVTDQDIESVWNAIESATQTSENNSNNLHSQNQNHTNGDLEQTSVETNKTTAKKRKQDEENTSKDTLKKKSKKSKVKNENNGEQAVEESSNSPNREVVKSIENTNGKEEAITENTLDIPKKKSKKSKLKKQAIENNNSDTSKDALSKVEESHQDEEGTSTENTTDIPKKKSKKSTIGSEGNSEQIKEAVVSKKKKAGGENDSKEIQNGNFHASSNDLEEASTFSYKDNILKILEKKSPISKKKLQKKVLCSYQQITGNEPSEKIVKKFEKNLKKLDTVSVTDEVVQLNSL